MARQFLYWQQRDRILNPSIGRPAIRRKRKVPNGFGGLLDLTIEQRLWADWTGFNYRAMPIYVIPHVDLFILGTEFYKAADRLDWAAMFRGFTQAHNGRSGGYLVTECLRGSKAQCQA